MASGGRPRPADILCGGLIAGCGLVALYLSQTYRMGSLTSMGPGFFPAMLGALLIPLGLAVGFLERLEGAIPKVPVRALLTIAGGILAFAVTIDRLGLAPAVFASVLISRFAVREARPLTAVLTAAALAIVCVAVFDWGLGLQMRAFG